MFCNNCGKNLSDNAMSCPVCGEQTSNKKVANYLVQAILMTIFCLPLCIPAVFGMVAIIYSVQVNRKLAVGDVDGAFQSSKKAKIWCWICFGVGVFFTLMYVIAVGSMPKSPTAIEKSVQSETKSAQVQKTESEGTAAEQFERGVGLAEGKGVPKNEKEALVWLRKAADRGHAEAQFYLGTMYFDGKGIRKDYPESEKWFRKAADQGISGAQFMLGLFYFEGKVVKKNDTEAAALFHKAADQGLTEAQNQLGLMYYKGYGVQINNSESIKWFRKAADQGHAKAKQNLENVLAEQSKQQEASDKHSNSGQITGKWSCKIAVQHLRTGRQNTVLDNIIFSENGTWETTAGTSAGSTGIYNLASQDISLTVNVTGNNRLFAGRINKISSNELEFGLFDSKMNMFYFCNRQPNSAPSSSANSTGTLINQTGLSHGQPTICDRFAI